MGWHHHIILDEEATRRRRSDRVLIFRLLKYLLTYREETTILLLVMIVGVGITLAIPFLSQVAIDQYLLNSALSHDQRFEGLSHLLSLLFLAYLGNFFVQLLRTYLTALIGRRIESDIRMSLFTHLQALSLNYFNQQEVGRIISRVTNDVDHLTELITSGVITAVTDILILVGVVGMMLYLYTPLALISFSILPPMILFVWLFGKKARDAYRHTRRTISNVTSQVEESVSGMREIQAYSKEQISQQDFERVNVQDLEANLSAAKIQSIFFPAVEFFSAVGLAIVLYAGGLQYSGPPFSLSWGVLYAFIQYLNRFFFPLRDLSMFYNNIQSALSGAERIFDLLDTESEIQETTNLLDLPPIKGEIRFNAVTFSYTPNTPVLNQINLTIKPQERVALVGPTGAGKTSLINLVYRFYDPQEGEILVDDYDLQDVSVRSLRSQMALVLQDPFLFSCSIKDNIRYGNIHASDEDIVQVAKAVGAHDFINALPDGYETEARERGGRLSMGQRQLISFARALIADPSILILDEATSSIDAYTEQLIQRALETLLKGRTALIIAHRLSTVRNAHRIVVLDKGRIVDEGQHENLIQKKGLYKRLYEMQFR